MPVQSFLQWRTALHNLELCSGPFHTFEEGHFASAAVKRVRLYAAGDGTRGSLKVPIEESESKTPPKRNRDNSTRYKTTGNLPETCPKGRFYFLLNDFLSISQVPISRLEAQINRAMPKGQPGPSNISANPGVWPKDP